MPDALLFLQFLDIWFDIGSLKTDDMKTSTKKRLLPSILWGVPDIERLWSARLEIGTIDLGTRTVIVEVSRIFVWL